MSEPVDDAEPFFKDIPIPPMIAARVTPEIRFELPPIIALWVLAEITFSCPPRMNELPPLTILEILENIPSALPFLM